MPTVVLRPRRAPFPASRERAVPRYFFQVHDGAFRPDREGTELADLASARVAAVELAGSLLKEGAEAFWRGHDWRVDVEDVSGSLLFALRVDAIPAGAPISPSA